MMQIPDRLEDMTDAQLRAIINMDQPRGTRNANPGNIEDGPFARSQPGYAGSDGRFALFDTPEHGEAANGALMQHYGQQGLNTPLKIISRYAPPGENDTQAYAERVAQALGVRVNDPINLSDPQVRQTVFQAINGVENGAQGSAPDDLDQLSDEELRVVAYGHAGTVDDPIIPEELSPEDQDTLDQGMYVLINGEPKLLAGKGTRDGVSGTPVAPGVNVREANPTSDVIQSLGSGLVQGATGLIGLPRAANDLAVQGAAKAADFFGADVSPEAIQMAQGRSPLANAPSTESLNAGLAGAFGPLHEPETTAGEYAQTIGEFAPGVAVPGGAGAKLASWLVPAVASETAGQVTRRFSPENEGTARVLGGLLGGVGVGGASMIRGGPDSVIRSATRGVNNQQLEESLQLRNSGQSMGVPLTQAEALQQVTGGATGLGRVQRVVEGTSPRMAPAMAERPGQVRQAVDNLTNQIGPQVSPAEASRLGQTAAEGVIDTMGRRVNESARPFYDRLPGQSLPPEQYAQLAENPSYAKALESVRGDPEISPLLNAELPMDEATRMLRARQQGFNTDKAYYHGSRQPFEGPFRTDLTNRGALGEGLYVTRRPNIASEYAGPEGAVYPTYIRGSVLDTTTPEGGAAFRAGQDADIIRAPGQSVVRNPESVRSTLDPFGAPTPDNDLNVVNLVTQQLDSMKSAATPGVFNPSGNRTLAGVRGDARGLANQLASDASPDFATARETVRTGREAFVDPLKRGPLGVIAGQPELRPTLPQQTGALFPAAPAEGGADQTLQALRLMNEIEPGAGPALTRQHIATQANELLQDNATGPNQFGGAKLAAQLMGNPEQERALLGAIDQAEPFNDARRLAEVLRATGQRETPGSNTAFNAQLQNEIAGGNVAQETTRAVLTPTTIPGRVAALFDNSMTRANSDKLADFLLSDPEAARSAILRAQLNRSGSNRLRTALALTQGED